ncbi:hypothetical protein [Escherichia coli]|uniref:hypothetical protein n=1 Tax=Escherichia coli TaxID=562 RepID=UPI00191A76D7|nr:hypothetical protein [Escherichia coli]CAD6116548.1 Uncharacterised protein [Escherichia coli]CAD6167413.1 Uncharacterised protein [Escherichia coli]
MKLILTKEAIAMLKKHFIILQIMAKDWGFTFKPCFLNVFTLLFLCEGIFFSSPVFATVIYEKNLITQSSYRKTSREYKLQFNNQDNYYEVSSVTGDCALSSVITSAQNNVNWNVSMGLTSHFNGKQTYLENVPVTDFNGIASQVGRKSDWNGLLGQWLPSGASWRKKGIGTGWYNSQAVNFPTPVTVDGGPERFDITIRMCRGDDGSYINATGHYVTSAANSMSVTPTSATLQSPMGTIAADHAEITLNGFMPSKIEFTSNVANSTTDYTLTLPEPLNPNYVGQSYDAILQFEYRVDATKPGNFVIPVNITAIYP